MATPSLPDRMEIYDLFVRYTTALDACEIENVVACFAAECSLESPVLGEFRGHAGIRDFATRTLRQKQEHGAQFRHVISNLAVDVEGDRARATCYLLDFVTIRGDTQLLSPGRYDCNLIRTDGKWLFTRRVVLMDRDFTLPGAPASR